MRALAALLLIGSVLAAPALAQSGPSTYVHMAAQPDFQYSSDKDVSVPFQAMLVRDNVPQGDPVRITVQARSGGIFPVKAAEHLVQGVAPYPSTNTLNLGKLDAGLYQLNVIASAGGQSKTFYLDFAVTLPPTGYEGILRGKGADAVFAFEPHKTDANKTFTIRVYRDSAGGRVVLEEVTTYERTTVAVPSIPGEPVKVEVEGPNKWLNYGNKQTDWVTGASSFPAWVWFPDYDQVQQVRDRSPWVIAGVGLLNAAMLTVLVVAIKGYRQRRDAQPPEGQP